MVNPFKKYYCIKQHDISDCGAACLATVFKQYGLRKSISQIRQISGTDRMGTNALGLIKAAKEIGFNAKGVKASPDQLNDKIPLPAIAHVVKDNLLHYVVIHRIVKDELLIADPGEGLKKYKKDEFQKIWSGILILLVPDTSFKKADDTTGLFTRFLSIIFPHKKIIIEIFISSIIFTLLGILGAFYFKFLIDEILVGGLEKSLHIISIGMVILTVFKILMEGFRKHLLLYLSQKIDVALIFNYYQHVLKLPMSFFDSRRVGEILSRLNDASKIREAISGTVISVLIDTLLIIGGGIVLYLQSWQLFLLALFFIPFSILIVAVFTKPFQKGHRKVMSQAAETESYLIETLNGISTVKALNAEYDAVLETENRFIKMIKSGFKVGLFKNLQFSLQNFITLIGGIVILWVGGYLVIKGQLSIGQLITFNALLVYFFNPIQSLINLQPTLQEAYVAAERLGEILDLDIESENDSKLLKPDSFKGDISFQDVNFRYGTRQNVLENINLKILRGEKIAIVGESGSGKTTLVKLILKYYLPEKGEISIDDQNIKDIQIENLRNKTGYVPQDVFLFSGTIRDNISFGKDNVSFEEIVEACKTVQAHEFINEFPLRYDTIIGERGATLSGGQKQRIALARAFLGNPDILILDEATSNLDSITEKAIHSTVERISNDKTTIVIAHRLSTIMKCDRIIVMDKGKIAEIGSHNDLLHKTGLYRKLWEGQSLSNIKEEMLA